MALKIVVIPYGKGSVRFFTGFVGGTEWPEYTKKRERARILGASAAADVISRIRGRTGWKAKAVTFEPAAS